MKRQIPENMPQPIFTVILRKNVTKTTIVVKRNVKEVILTINTSHFTECGH